MFCALGLLTANAATASFETNTLGGANIQPMTPVTVGEVTLSFAKGSGTSEPGYFANGNDIRLYAKNTMTVTAKDGYKVDKIVITVGNNSQLAKVAVTQGTIEQTTTEATWTGAASNFTFTVGEKAELGSDTNKAGQLRFTKVEVTYSEGQGATDPDPEPEPEVTVLTVKEALAKLAAGENNIKAQVKGLISEIQEISTNYGNATYFIKDQLSDSEALEVYRGYSIDGAKFTKADEIAVGGTVTVEGTLVDYNGTYEFTTGSKIIDYVAPAGGGNEGGDQPTVPTPEGPEATVAFYAGTTSAPTGVDYATNLTGTLTGADAQTFSAGDITISFAQGAGQTNNSNVNGAQVRWYKGDTMYLEPSNGATITKVVINAVSSYAPQLTASTGTVVTEGTTITWTGSTNTTLALTSDAAQTRFTVVTITYAQGEAPAVAAPKISCANNTVSIECVTDGAEIYYTTDGNAPSKASTKYTAPFAITANTVVKAIAYVDADASAVTTYNAVYEGSYAGFEAFVAAGTGTEGTVNGPITAVYQNGSYLYVVDSNNYPMLVYGSVSATDLANGDKIANVKGKYSPYNGLPELTNPVLGEVTKGGSTAIEPEVIAAEEVATDMVNMYVEFTDMLIAAEGTNYTMSDETGSIALYNRFSGITMPTDLDATYTVRGFVSIYGTTIQIYPTEFIQSGVAIERAETPTFNPAGGAVEAGTKVAITTATEGATIFYTTDGTEPTIESTEYTGEIEITAAMTIKAIAVKEGLNNSVVATASYTIVDPNATEATFDFTDEAWLTSEGVTVPADASTGQNIAGTDFTVNAITLTFPANEASNVARIWRLTANSGGGVQLRVFAGDNFTISASESYEITGIEFKCDATYQNFEPNTGTLTSEGAWTPAEKTTSVTFSPSKASRINTITVNYKSTSGVNDVLNNDKNAPVEYYNLQGVRVANPAAGNLYIVRQGNNVSKVIVR